MKNEKVDNEVEKLKAMTVKSLTQSIRDLEQLSTECRECGKILHKKQDSPTFTRVAAMAEHLHEFNVFQSHICSMFQTDTSSLKDDKGSLTETRIKFSYLMNLFLDKLDKNDIPSAANLLEVDIADTLTRYRELLPTLTNYIENDYAVTNA